MSDLDAATISAIAALVVAGIALLVALAQALQQYFITGQLIRLCDSVVFGPLPGQGHRIWQPTQFRFRVIYKLPQISLQADLWPGKGGAITKSYSIGRDPLPPLANVQTPDQDAASKTARRNNPSFCSDIVISYKPRRWYNPVSWFGRTPPDVASNLTRTSTNATRSTRASMNGRGNATPTDGSKFDFRRLQFWKGPQKPPELPSNQFYPEYTREEKPPGLASRAKGWVRSKLPRRDSGDTSRDAASVDTDASFRPSSPTVGEASWVSFCRAIEFPCGDSVRIDFVEYDADRCPSDLVCAPMQVSMRDIIIMGLTVGMEITSASFDGKSVSMQGAVGTLTTSNHPVLGPILHFTPRSIEASLPRAFGVVPFRLGARGSVDKRWMARTWDVCSVADRYYNSISRRTARRLDERWMKDNRGVQGFEVHRYESDMDSDDGQQRMKRRGRAGKGKSNAGLSSMFWGEKDDNGEDKSAKEKDKSPAAEKVGAADTPKVVKPQVPRDRDGFWTIEEDKSNRVKVVRVVGNGYVLRVLDPERKQVPTPPVNKSTDSLSARPQPARVVRHETPKEAEEIQAKETNDQGGPSTNPPASDTSSQLSGSDQERHARRRRRYRERNAQRRRATVEDAPEEDPDDEVIVIEEKEPADPESSAPTVDRIATAKARQAARSDKLRSIQEDKKVVQDSVKRGTVTSPYGPNATQTSHTLLLTNYAHNSNPKPLNPAASDAESESESESPNPEAEATDEATKAEHEAWKRELERERQRHERNEAREERNKARFRAVGLTKIDVFWICQMDIQAGFWATPWHDPHQVPLMTSIDGAVTVILEALLGFFADPDAAILYTDAQRMSWASFQWTAEWMYTGRTTYPAYALNARGGVVAQGWYVGVQVAGFEGLVPALELLHSYDWQVDSMQHDPAEIDEQNVELMRLDAWLSYVGRMEEISAGPHQLLKQTPALVQLLVDEFEMDFQNIDLSAKEGGLQDIQGLAANVMDFLTDEELSEPEQLYVLVALLRAVKVAQVVRLGSDTYGLRRILESDVQAHLV
ncbi:hypothetical protein B0T19DRAFT_107789 [Cercophora scortea]|uniref:Uncharacterized protein n=1 Tax=Cercophora scortea TaxID=314031 RepID=A0AAE0MHQ3_9PEZI|nr:hypothetical protein B0T19DRAFT_107789 [Cercophora scortea]